MKDKVALAANGSVSGVQMVLQPIVARALTFKLSMPTGYALEGLTYGY